MKRQIRGNVFETNSSSTHSIAIPKESSIPNHISFHVGDFGWAFEDVSSVDYFYTAIYEVSETEAEAEALKIAAEAEAAANKLLTESLTDKVLQDKFYAKWDGKLPTVMGDNSVITDIGKID